jgi:hypothetical protein
MNRKRRYSRARERHKVRIAVESVPGAVEKRLTRLTGWTEDISTGGLKVVCRKSVPAGATLSLEITCSHPLESFFMKGHVIWARADMQEHRCHLGIIFDRGREEEFLRWSRAVDRRACGR